MALHLLLDTAVDDLLCRWRAHDDLRRRPNATCKQLAQSRAELEVARRRACALRKAFNPTRENLPEGTFVFCTHLEQVVHLRQGLGCVCGLDAKLPAATS